MNAQFTQDELLSLNNSQLTELYHGAQLAAVVSIVDEDFLGAEYWLGLSLAARDIVYNRFGKVDAGHAKIYNELLAELENVQNRLAVPIQCPYFFKSGTLVGNAIDNSLYVPQEMYPVRWCYSDYYVKKCQSSANKRRYQARQTRAF